MKHLLLFSCVVCFLLPSCACVWNIGQNIRSSSTVYVGADTQHSVDGLVYRKDGDIFGEEYMYAREVTYKLRRDTVECYSIMGPPGVKVYDVAPTGRTVLVRIDNLSVTRVDSIPEGFKAQRDEWRSLATDSSICVQSNLGEFEDERSSRGSVCSQIVAAPFDFAVDPVLTATTSVIGCLGFGIVAGWLEVCNLFDVEGEEEKEDLPKN